MPTIKNPTAPATERQLFRLHQLTGKDTREWNITMQQASNQIEGLELEHLEKEIPETVVNDDHPFTEAHVTIVNGDQRGGKSNTLVAFPVGDYFNHLDAIVSPSGERIKAKVINKDDKALLKKCGIYPSFLNYVRVYSDDEKQSKLIKLPKDYFVLSPVHIFSNFHLYGVKYAYIGIEDIIQYINTDLFNDAWILSDESVMTDARNSMDSMGKLIAAFGATVGKRNAKLCIAAQYNEMVERRFRLFATTRITCSYDQDTKYVFLDIKKRGEPMFSTEYYAPQYWRFFNTKELIRVPQDKIDRALAKIYKTEALAR